jgi:3-dehydroquinate synthase
MIIPVHSDLTDYNIYLERGALAKAGEVFDLDRKVLVVTDSGVPSVYSDTVASLCSQPVKVCIEQGEKSKSIENWTQLLSVMLKNGFTRSDCVVAVGGGVVGDLSAFAAACYMRGIDFYNIPTTLLSQVDSSIGGKAAVDFEGVKNIVGAFKQPCGVLIDPDTLATLDRRQMSAGLAEAIKMAVTSDAQLLELIENTEDFEGDLTEIIRRALMIKKDVVEQDPTEKGLRKVLNFGHTAGHAIESFADGRLLHGECVALGMLPMCGENLRTRVEAVLEKYSLPRSITQTADELAPFIAHDKKKSSSFITVVMSDEAGTFRFEKMTVDEIKQLLEKVI